MEFIEITKEFKEICEQIIKEKKSLTEWIAIESCDMFQTENYCGGFDGIENKFTFSFYNLDGKEYWLEVSLEEVKKVSANLISRVEIHPAQ